MAAPCHPWHRGTRPCMAVGIRPYIGWREEVHGPIIIKMVTKGQIMKTEQ